MAKKLTLDQSLDVAEASRERKKHEGFLAGLFEAEVRSTSFPLHYPEPSDQAQSFLNILQQFLIDKVDPELIDKEGEISDALISDLKKMKAFGIKIPVSYGGHGLSQSDYHHIGVLLGGYDASLTALLSAHNSIGVPEPLKQFGNPEQKERLLPRLANGEISGFALTEETAGCDISGILTYAVRVKKDGKTVGYRLNGRKLYTTNAPKNNDEFLATLLVVIARIVDDPEELHNSGAEKCFGAFIVETKTDGCKVLARLRFEGVRAIYNGALDFSHVYVPTDNLLGHEGDGLKIALTTLTIGRLTLPAACLGALKRCLWFSRLWAKERVQWGKSIGEHGLISEKIVRMAARTLALEGIVKMTGVGVDSKQDVRLESAAAKILATEWLWDSVNDLLQIRGGRGFETTYSLISHNELPMPVGRMMRDARINLIWEGTSEIMRMWIARECLAEYFKHGMNLKYGRVSEKASAVSYYAKMLVRGVNPFSGSQHTQKMARELTRLAVFGTMYYQTALQHKQLLLKKLVDASINLFAAAVASTYATSAQVTEKPLSRELADFFCHDAKKTIQPASSLRKNIFNKDDTRVYKIVKRILKGEAEWLEEGIIKNDVSAMQKPRGDRGS